MVLWGGHDECIGCAGNHERLNYTCNMMQERGWCPAETGYPERLRQLKELAVPKFHEGRALLFWTWKCQSLDILTQEVACRRFIKGLARTIGMTAIAGPHSVTFDPPTDRPEDAGISAVLVIEESHLAVHTFPRQNGGAAQITIVSCKDFQPTTCTAWISDTLQALRCHVECLGGEQGFFVPND